MPKSKRLSQNSLKINRRITRATNKIQQHIKSESSKHSSYPLNQFRAKPLPHLPALPEGSGSKRFETRSEILCRL